MTPRHWSPKITSDTAPVPHMVSIAISKEKRNDKFEIRRGKRCRNRLMDSLSDH